MKLYGCYVVTMEGMTKDDIIVLAVTMSLDDAEAVERNHMSAKITKLNKTMEITIDFY